MRRFNIAGNCQEDKHYMLPPLPRIPQAWDLVQDLEYFVLHAPRQSGKTTSIRALRNELNRQGNHYAVYCSLESPASESYKRNVIVDITATIRKSVLMGLPGLNLQDLCIDEKYETFVLRDYLNNLCARLDKPLVLLLDEVDSFYDESLLSLLRQLRDGYVNREDAPFPASIALVGMRNIRDYKIRLRPDSESLRTASPFNIVAKPLTLAAFTPEQIAALYAQHTAETGQRFQDGALERVHYWTGGQPWLVNAVARECVEEICRNDFTREITPDLVDQAAYAIILRRDIHIDSLLARLREPRVQRIIQPVITGDGFFGDELDDDLNYVIDMGLLTPTRPYRPANRMYAEVFLRTLSADYQQSIRDEAISPAWARPDGLDMGALLRGFQQFWRENSEIYTSQAKNYTEALPHLVLMGFLQRVVNGGGRITREGAVGCGRLDLLVEFRGGRYPIELKIKGHSSRPQTIAQLLDYMDGYGLKEGWLVTFDRSPDLGWEQKLTWEDRSEGGKTIHLVGA